VARQRVFPRVGSANRNRFRFPNEIVFLYDTVNSSEQNAFRVISTDGRDHDGTLNPSYYGDSIGHWGRQYDGHRRDEFRG